MAELRFSGRPASPGVAIGPFLRLSTAPKTPTAGRDAEGDGAEQFRRAVARAMRELENLTGDVEEEAAAILAFQLEILNDASALEEVTRAIESGQSAIAAWRAWIERQRAPFLADPDPYFRARAEDLADLGERILRALADDRDSGLRLAENTVLLATDLSPSRFLSLDRRRLGGIALEAGSANSHMAMLARARDVPLVVGLGSVDGTGDVAILDGGAGLLLLDPTPDTRKAYERRLQEQEAFRRRARAVYFEPARTAGGERVQVMVNVDDPDALFAEAIRASDGAGLVRTEFLFVGRAQLPDEEQQYAAYRSLLARFGERPVRIRTLDAGGDKPVPGITLDDERNPFLGLRGIRLCLARPQLFRTQLRALLRAAAHGRLEIMLPMVSRIEEVEETRSILRECRDELARSGIETVMPPLGIMVETPAAALTLDRFRIDFASIGSNDLTQYVMAAARDATGEVADLADPGEPAVRALLATIVERARAAGIPLSLCGDMAADRSHLYALLRMGLRSVSVAPAVVAAVKLWIREYDGEKDERPPGQRAT